MAITNSTIFAVDGTMSPSDPSGFLSDINTLNFSWAQGDTSGIAIQDNGTKTLNKIRLYTDSTVNRTVWYTPDGTSWTSTVVSKTNDEYYEVSFSHAQNTAVVFRPGTNWELQITSETVTGLVCYYTDNTQEEAQASPTPTPEPTEAPTETFISTLKVNKLTKAQYDAITPSSSEIYEFTDLSSLLDRSLSSGRNIGEIIPSTIPLTDAGLHLLDGALINGSGIYSDFVDYIANLYTENPNANYFMQGEDTAWTRPDLSANGTLGGDSFAVSASSNWSSNYPAYAAVDGSDSSWWASDSASSNDFIFYNPIPLKVTQLSWSSYGDEYTTQGTIYGSNDNSEWTSLTTYTNSSQNIVIDLSSNTNYYKYYKISSSAYQSYDFSILELNITATYVNSSAETAWQSAVSTYGVCGKFVYDSVNNTVRLPKITGIVEGTTDLTALGDLVQAGLPIMNSSGAHTHTRGTMNITGSVGVVGANVEGASGCFYPNGGGATAGTGGFGSNSYIGFNAASSWSGETSSNGSHTHTFNGVGISSTVQPQTIKVLYYIVIATSTKTEIQVDIDEIATDLNGKADTDLSNLSQSAQSLLDKITTYPKLYIANGIIANSDGGTLQGVGTATVKLYADGLAEIHADYQVITAGTNSSLFYCGLNSDLLRVKNASIPEITPLSGGTLAYINNSGTMDTGLTGAGGLSTAIYQFWLPSRVFDSNGSTGGWPESSYYQYLHIRGVYYGTYTVGTEG